MGFLLSTALLLGRLSQVGSSDDSRLPIRIQDLPPTSLGTWGQERRSAFDLILEQRALDLASTLENCGTEPARETPWSVRASLVGEALRGNALVRENQIGGTHLNIHQDLGMAYQEGGRIDVFYDQGGIEGCVDVEYLVGSGRNPRHPPFNFNGYTFQANDPLNTLNYFLTVRLHLAFKDLLGVREWGWTGPLIGLEYPYYYMNVTSKAAPHDSEDWVHYYPYPVVGWGGRVSLLDALTLEGRVTIGYFPNLASLYIEGGRLFVSVRPSLWIDLPLVWKVSDSVSLTLGFEYQYWNGGDHSVEDGNRLRFSSPGLSLGVGLTW